MEKDYKKSYFHARERISEYLERIDDLEQQIQELEESIKFYEDLSDQQDAKIQYFENLLMSLGVEFINKNTITN